VPDCRLVVRFCSVAMNTSERASLSRPACWRRSAIVWAVSPSTMLKVTSVALVPAASVSFEPRSSRTRSATNGSFRALGFFVA